MKLTVLFIVAAIVTGHRQSSIIVANEPRLISNMEDLVFAPPKPVGRIAQIEGKSGKGLELFFEKDAKSAFFTSNIRGTPEWDVAEGLSFWVKGNGSLQFGGLELIYDDDYALRYDYCFPIKGSDWTKVTVAWSDFIPVLPHSRSHPLGTKLAPASKISAVWFGKWWYWGTYPATQLGIDELCLEPRVERIAIESPPKTSTPLKRLRDKLNNGQPITIVTMGDSLTDTRHWANKDVAWPALVAEQLTKQFQSKVTIVNPAVGGTQLRQNLVLMPRWLESTPQPDLVTVFFGGNDWDAGMRGDEFAAACTDAVDRIRRATQGHADVLLITTNPTIEKWNTMSELSSACRTVATQKSTGLADTDALFHAEGSTRQDTLFVDDKVHLSRSGHELVARAVLNAIASPESTAVDQ